MADRSLAVPDIQQLVDANGRPTVFFSAWLSELQRRIEDHEARITALEP